MGLFTTRYIADQWGEERNGYNAPLLEGFAVVGQPAWSFNVARHGVQTPASSFLTVKDAR